MGEAPRHGADPVGPVRDPLAGACSSGASRPRRTRSRARRRTTGPSGSAPAGCRAAATRCGAGSGHRERWEDDLGAPALARRQRLPLLARAQPDRARAGPILRGGPRARGASASRPSRAWGSSRCVTLHHYTHPRWFWARRRLGEPGERRGVRAATPAVARGARAARADLGHAERADRLRARRLPRRRRSRPAGAASRRPRARSSTCCARTSRRPRRSLREGPRRARRHRPQHARVRAGSSRPARSTAGSRGEASASTTPRCSRRSRRATSDWSFPGRGPRRRRVADLPAANRLLGVNYYSRVHIRFRGVPGPIGEFLYRDPRRRGLTDTGWEIHPEGFDAVLRRRAQTGLPIIVTENGDRDRATTGVRRDFLREHALVLAHAARPGRPSTVLPLVAARQLRVARGLPAPLRPLRRRLRDVRGGGAPVRRPLRAARPALHGGQRVSESSVASRT